MKPLTHHCLIKKVWASFLCQSKPFILKLTSHCLLFGLDASHDVLVLVYPHTLPPLCSFIWCFTLLGMSLPFLSMWPNLGALKIFLNPKSSTHTPSTQNCTTHFTCHVFTFYETLVFFSFFRDKTTFFFFVSTIYYGQHWYYHYLCYYHYPCYPYFTIKLWEIQRLLGKYIT